MVPLSLLLGLAQSPPVAGRQGADSEPELSFESRFAQVLNGPRDAFPAEEHADLLQTDLEIRETTTKEPEPPTESESEHPAEKPEVALADSDEFWEQNTAAPEVQELEDRLQHARPERGFHSAITPETPVSDTPKGDMKITSENIDTVHFSSHAIGLNPTQVTSAQTLSSASASKADTKVVSPKQITPPAAFIHGTVQSSSQSIETPPSQTDGSAREETRERAIMPGPAPAKPSGIPVTATPEAKLLRAEGPQILQTTDALPVQTIADPGSNRLPAPTHAMQPNPGTVSAQITAAVTQPATADMAAPRSVTTEIGLIRIDLGRDETGATLILSVETDDARNILRKQGDQIAADVRAALNTSVQVDVRSSGHPRNTAPQDALSDAPQADTAPEAQPSPAHLTAILSSRLDIRI